MIDPESTGKELNLIAPNRSFPLPPDEAQEILISDSYGESIAHPKHPERNDDSCFFRGNFGGAFGGVATRKGPNKASAEAAMLSNQTLVDTDVHSTPEESEELLRSKIIEADQYVARSKGSGATTASLAGVFEYDGSKHLSVARVGNSIAGLFSEGSFRRLTEEHTLASEIDSMGETPARELPGEQRPNFLGKGIAPRVYTDSAPVKDGDIAILSTDGLPVNLSDEEIVAKIDSLGANPTAKMVVKGLIKAAFKRSIALDPPGSAKKDDITVVAMKI